MRFTLLSGVRNDLVQLISDQTAASELHLHQIDADIQALLTLQQALPSLSNPVCIPLGSRLATPEHTISLRASYTVPVNRRAVLGGISLSQQVITAGAPPIALSTAARVRIGGAAAANFIDHETRLPVLFEQYTREMTLNILLAAGDIVEINTTALGIAGVYMFAAHIACTEYDA